MRRVFLILIAVLFTLGADKPKPAPAPATASSDGVDYGEPVKVAGFTVPKLPIIGATLGAPPSAMVGKRDVWSRAKSFDKAKKLVAMSITPDHGPAFISEGIGGADAIGFDVADGRVWRIVLYFPNSSEEKIVGLKSRLTKAVKDVTPKIEVSGGVSVSFRGERKIGTVYIKFAPAEWYLSCHPDTAANVAEAMRAKKLCVGMTEAEADVSMVAAGLVKKTDIEDAASKLVSYYYESSKTSKFSANVRYGRLTRVFND